MSTLPSNRLLWFGVLGGGVSWLVQFTAGLEATWFTCGYPGEGRPPLHALQIAVGAAGLLVALTAMAVCIRLFLRTVMYRDLSKQVLRGFGGQPPLGRIHFLAIVGIVVNLLVIAIMLMTTIGAPELLLCRQS